jgi:hypothetical protein
VSKKCSNIKPGGLKRPLVPPPPYRKKITGNWKIDIDVRPEATPTPSKGRKITKFMGI